MDLRAKKVETIEVDGLHLPFVKCNGHYEIHDRVFDPKNYTIVMMDNLLSFMAIDRYLSSLSV